MTRTVSLPWLTAAGLTRTAPLMTTVPVRALTMTRAGGSERVISKIFDQRHHAGCAHRRPLARLMLTVAPSMTLARVLAEQPVDRIGDAASIGGVQTVQVEESDGPAR